MKVCKT